MVTTINNQWGGDPTRGEKLVHQMLHRGFMLGVGFSSSLGWYELVGFDPKIKHASSSRLIRSCTNDERAYVLSQTLDNVSCKADSNSGDMIHTVVQLVARQVEQLAA